MNKKLPHPLLNRLLVTAGLVLLAGLVVATAFFNVNSQQAANPVLPNTILFQLRNDDGQAVFSAIIPSGSSRWLVLPSNLSVGAGRSLAESADSLDFQSGSKALRAATGITVDATWRLDRLGLAAMIDQIGAVYLTPDADVTLTDSNGAGMVLTKGQRTVIENSGLAARYATDCEPQFCAGRFRTVWRQVIGLWRNLVPQRVLESMGSTSTFSLGQAQLVAVLESMYKYNQTEPVKFSRLPSAPAAGSGGARVVLTPAAITQLQDAGVEIQPLD